MNNIFISTLLFPYIFYIRSITCLADSKVYTSLLIALNAIHRIVQYIIRVFSSHLSDYIPLLLQLQQLLLLLLHLHLFSIGRKGGPFRPEYTIKYVVIPMLFFLSGLTLPTRYPNSNYITIFIQRYLIAILIRYICILDLVIYSITYSYTLSSSLSLPLYSDMIKAMFKFKIHIFIQSFIFILIPVYFYSLTLILQYIPFMNR